MFILFLVATIVIILLVFFMFFILRGTVRTINSQTKLYFVDKLQEYDYLINQKEEKLNQINQEIKKREIDNRKQNEKFQDKGYEFDYQVIDLLNKTKYQDKNVFELSKQIEAKFDLNYQKILEDFLENVHDDGSYDFCLRLKEKFNSDVIYDLKVLPDDKREEYLETYLQGEELEIYRIFKKINDSGEVDLFMDYLNELVDLNNPNIVVYVGSKSENYDYLSKYIKTVYTSDIYRGIKILYKRKIYDYSLNERNV